MVGLTLTRYLTARFAKAIAGVFATIFLLIYLIDFVEMLRRSAGLATASTSLIAAPRPRRPAPMLSVEYVRWVFGRRRRMAVLMPLPAAAWWCGRARR